MSYASYTRLRSMPGQLYGLKNNTRVYWPLELNGLGEPRLEVGGAGKVKGMRQLHNGDLVVVIANEQDVETMAWSLCMYIDGTLEYPTAKLGWIHNDQLQWVD